MYFTRFRRASNSSTCLYLIVKMTMQVLECGQTDHQLCNESLKIFVFCELGCLAICPRRHFFLSCQCSKVDAKWMGLLKTQLKSCFDSFSWKAHCHGVSTDFFTNAPKSTCNLFKTSRYHHLNSFQHYILYM